ncbi:MAG: VOC family protein [Paracoccus sp. (in: a-proteobacteria)]|uniref:VOC family protein n=1 Tax=Paracoccus sp. TaxID=267 RepID=UPI0026BB490F
MSMSWVSGCLKVSISRNRTSDGFWCNRRVAAFPCCWRAPTSDAQNAVVGDQTGGRVFLFLETDDLRADLARLRRAGIRIIREPRLADCGIAAVFADLYGNLRDLIQRPAEAG